MIEAGDWALQVSLALRMLAALAAGLLIGMERGWIQRAEPAGSRVAGFRTFSLIGISGGLTSIFAVQFSYILAGVLLGAMTIILIGAFLLPRVASKERDATTMVAAMVTLALGLLAGAGYAALALAGAAVSTLLLSLRQPMHGMLKALTEEEMRAIARFAVIAIAVLPFLPDAAYGPYEAWNPFKLWLVVILVTGFSIIGYISNRVIGQQRGTIATAVIGGAYSSTAVTAAFASQMKEGNTGHFATGIALASAIMYVRVIVLAAVLAPAIAFQMLALLAPAALVAFLLAWLIWRREEQAANSQASLTSKPFELLPALGFLLAVAAASLLVHWAQAEFGERGAAFSLFVAGSFDVDAAIIAYAVLPTGAVQVAVAALALAGTVTVNMSFKAAIVFANAGKKVGRMPGLALIASCAVLALTLAIRAIMLFG